MKRFKNIIVGVDLANNEQLVANKLSDATHAAIANGIWLAKHNDADYVVASGKSWVELIRQVLKQRHDLVITGTRQRGAAASVLFGSTGMKLLRKCPCPVWITKPQERQHITSVLVADDFICPVGIQ